MTRIGVVSDTHNYVDPKLAELFAGVDHILHAGDIGQPRVIRELEQLAPVTAVAGNTDDPMFGFRLVELVEVAGKFITLPIRSLDKITVCRAREILVSQNDRLHLKANRTLTNGGRVTNGELVTIKAVRHGGDIELTDGRVLDHSYREFLPGYAVTSYGSQGKTVDHVLFSDSTIKAATNAQQWYVTISRGRRGVHIFTPDAEQLRENVVRSGHRPLAFEFGNTFHRQPGVMLWDKMHGYLLRFGAQVADTFCRLKKQTLKQNQKHELKSNRMLVD